MTLRAILAFCTGEHTEVDKTLLEAIKDPLTHLIRNAIDHGLETPEVRMAIGFVAGLGLLVGLVWPPAMWLSSAGLTLLMMLGVGVRVRMNDSLLQTLPALVLMLVNGFILFASWPE